MHLDISGTRLRLLFFFFFSLQNYDENKINRYRVIVPDSLPPSRYNLSITDKALQNSSFVVFRLAQDLKSS